MREDDEEAFQTFETKIDEVTKILQMMNSADTSEQQTGVYKADQFLGNDRDYEAKLQMDDFIVRVKDDRTIINKAALQDAPLVRYLFNFIVSRDIKCGYTHSGRTQHR